MTWLYDENPENIKHVYKQGLSIDIQDKTLDNVV